MKMYSVLCAVAAFSAISLVDAFPGLVPQLYQQCYLEIGTTVMGIASEDAAVANAITFSPVLVGNHYTPGQVYTVTYKVPSGTRGVLMGSNAGTWSNLPAGASACDESSAGGGTGFSSGNSPDNSLQTVGTWTATWTAPASGNINIYASSAPGYGLVKTSVITATDGTGTFSPTKSPTTSAPTPAEVVGTLDSNFCDPTQYGTVSTASVPSIGADGYLACWKKDGDDYEIRLQCNTGLWCGLGISSNNAMPDTDMYWIVYNQGQVEGQIRYASDKSTPALVTNDPDYMTNVQTVSDGTTAQLKFKRPAVGKGQRASMDVASSFVLCATGPATEGYHGPKRVAAGGIDFAAAGSVAASKTLFSSPEKMAHGAMMVFAWLFLGPTAMFDARFMKSLLGPLWFKLHMYMMITVVLLTFVGIIIVATDELVDYDDIVEAASASGASDSQKQSGRHAQIGIAVMALAFFQMTIGLLRKKISNETPDTKSSEHPHGPRRWLFNSMHWAIGFTLLILTLTNVYTGFTLGPVEWVKTPVKDFYYVAVGLGVGCLVVIEILKLPGRISEDNAMTNLVNVLSRHAFALVAAGTLASAITVTAIIADSDQV